MALRKARFAWITTCHNSADSSRKSCSIGPRAVVSWFIQTGLGRFLGPLEASKSSLAPIVGESID